MEFENIKKSLKKSLIPPSAILSDFCVMDERIRESSDYNDPRYLPFYFYLGREMQPQSLIEIGFGMGLVSGCILKSCKSLEDFIAFEPEQKGYSPKIGIKNVKLNYHKRFYFHNGNILDSEFRECLQFRKWDLALINTVSSYDTSMSYLNMVWEVLKLDGIILVDNINQDTNLNRAFNDFCKVKMVEPKIFKNKKGIGVIAR